MALTFQNFYIDNATGSNVNAGDDKTVVTSTNGNWNSTSNVFTAASGTPFSGVVAGDFAAIYVDGASTAAWIARVTSVGGGGSSLTLNSTGAGVEPSTSTTGRTCTVGGKWAGPSGSVTFPFSLTGLGNLTSASSQTPRINMKSGTTYSVTSQISLFATGPISLVGYSSTIGDGGRPVISSSDTTAGLTTAASTNVHVRDIEVQCTAVSGTGVAFSGGVSTVFFRCVASGARGHGFGTAAAAYIGCKATDCGKASGAYAGFYLDYTQAVNCIAQDMATGTTANGFRVGPGSCCVNCIADTCTGDGFTVGGNGAVMVNCDSYNNGGHGYAGNFNYALVNCNAINNGTDGTGHGVSATNATIINTGFGAGTEANDDGTVTASGTQGVHEIGSVTYPSNVTPWTDPANGDFTLELAEAINAGWSVWAGNSTTGYASIGAAQPEAGGGGSTTIIARRGIGGM